MAIIGWKRIGWSKDPNKIKHDLLVQFDTQIERDCFEEIIDSIQAMQEIRK